MGLIYITVPDNGRRAPRGELRRCEWFGGDCPRQASWEREQGIEEPYMRALCSLHAGYWASLPARFYSPKWHHLEA